MKILILILAHDATNYDELQEIWKKYMNIHPHIQSYFMKLIPNIEKSYIQDNTIYTNGQESIIPGCLLKTIQSLKYLFEINVDFDYVFRTNLSSVVNLNKLYEIASNLHAECAGVIGHEQYNSFISGAGMLLSRKTCKHLTSSNDLNYNIVDDVAIGLFLVENKYKMIPLERCDYFINNLDFNKKTQHLFDHHFHYRCKCDNYANTVKVANHVVDRIYIII